MSIQISIPPDAIPKIDAALSRLDVTLRTKTVTSAMNKLGRVVVDYAKREVVRGDRRHNPEAKPLADTIGQVQRQRNGVFFQVVGARYPAGAHAHLVEGYKKPKRVVISRGPRKGQDTGMRAVAKPFMAPAVDATKTQQLEAFFGTIDQAIKESARGQ